MQTDARVAYLVLPALWALTFVFIIQWVDSSRDALLLLLEAIFCVLVYLNVQRLGVTAALHLVIGSLCVYQTAVLELNRDLTHIGSVWFLVPPLYAAVFGKRQHVATWAPISLLCILVAAFRASPLDPLWQHPLTLVNLLGALVVITICSFVLLRDRQRREATLEQALASAQNAERSKAQLLSVLSHELRTPLTAVAGAAELLADTPLSREQKARLQALRRGAQSMSEVLGNVLNLSRLESGHRQPGQQQVDIAETTENLLEGFRSEASTAGCQILIDIAPAMPVLWSGDVGCAQQVMRNLVSNAIKHTPNGWVRVAISAGDGLHIRVEDTGSGIEEDRLERIFEPYAQGASVDAVSGSGVGLGLAIVARIVELLDGSVSIASSPGVGTAFDVRLPFTALDAERRYSNRVRPPATGVRLRADSSPGAPGWLAAWAAAWQEHWQQQEAAVQAQARLLLSDWSGAEPAPTLLTAAGLSMWLTDQAERSA